MNNFSLGAQIDCKEINLSYKNKLETKQILADVSFFIEPGEMISICGKSGVGKSTLLKTLAGLQKIDDGSLKIDSVEIEGPIDRLGYVTQDYSKSLFPWLTAIKNIALPLKKTNLTRDERIQKAQQIMNEVGLEGYEQFYPWQLSGGMQQRVAIARALVATPRLLLLDEPFASLDAFTRFELEDLVTSLAKKLQITTVLVTHDIDEAIYFSDKIFVLKGNPSHVSRIIYNQIPWPREQKITRSSNNFGLIRSELLVSLE